MASQERGGSRLADTIGGAAKKLAGAVTGNEALQEEGELQQARGRAEAEAAEEAEAAATPPPKPKRARARPRGRARKPAGPLEGTFDHGEEGYGLWLDPAVEDDPIYAEFWAGHRPVEITVEENQIVIRRAGGDEDED